MEEDKERLIEEPEEFLKIEMMASEGEQQVFLKGQPYMRWRCEDQIAPRVAIVQLYESGLVGQEKLAKLFGVHERSVRNYISCFRMDGISGLMSQPRGPRESWKITPATRFKILEVVYRHKDITYDQIAGILRSQWRIEVSVNSIRQVLVENGFVEERFRGEGAETLELFASLPEQDEILFGESESVEGRRITIKRDETISVERADSFSQFRNRSYYSEAERVYLDQLERGHYSAYAGGFLFSPLLEQHHFLERIKDVISIETHEGYRLEQLGLTLFYFDLFDFRSIENFKTVYPEEFGVLMGRNASPSIYTLRRFMHRVRELKKADALIEEFGKEYLRSGLTQWGVMYIDSHFLPYYGMRVVTMGWHGVQDKALKGSYQFLGIDEKFNPLLFLVRPSSDDLLEIIPEMIEKARRLAQDVGIAADDLTVVFDREGYSAGFFRKLNDMQPKVKFITWAKYMDRWVGDYKEEQFDKRVTVDYEIQDSEEIKYLATKKEMNKYGAIRALVIESGRKNQRAAIYTNDDESDGGRIIQLMCRRWGQETLNKTFKWDHKMDYFPGYVADELEEQPLVDNPRLKELKKEKAGLVSKLNELRIKFARKTLSETTDEENWKDMKEKNKDLCVDITSLEAQITLLELEIGKFPKEVRFDEAHQGKELVEFDYEKKRFLDGIKMFTYMMEKKMCSILSAYYDDPKDIYSILSMIVRRGGVLKLEEGTLRVRLRRFYNPVVDYAARHLCEALNQMQPHALDKFHFKLRYEIA